MKLKSVAQTRSGRQAHVQVVIAFGVQSERHVEALACGWQGYLSSQARYFNLHPSSCNGFMNLALVPLDGQPSSSYLCSEGGEN